MLQPCRNSAIGSEAAREIAEHARAFYEHKVCGRKTMGNSVYVGTTGMLKASYINCTTIYEVRAWPDCIALLPLRPLLSGPPQSSGDQPHLHVDQWGDSLHGIDACDGGPWCNET